VPQSAVRRFADLPSDVVNTDHVDWQRSDKLHRSLMRNQGLTGPDVIDTPHGRCVIVDVDDDDASLVGDEVALARGLSPVRRRELIAGRVALRKLLGEDVAVARDDRGAPVLPAGWVGSISHKHDRAAALIAPAGAGFVGIDIEAAAPSRQPIERRILTPHERRALREPREVTLRFSIKEAIYKAVDPIVRRYVGFTEVELELAADGTCTVHVLDVSRLPVVVDAWWQERDGLWLATARATRR
jgi:enterobactin synthetase component D